MILECRILERKWKVSVVYDLNEINANGRTLFPTREIEINDKLTIPEMKHVLTHELTHAFLYECGYQQLDIRDIQLPQEFICEFVAIHSNRINKLSKGLMKEIKRILNKTD